MIDFRLTRNFNSEVLHASSRVLDIDKADMLQLCSIAAGTARQRSRFCAHSTSEEPLHEMFIVHPKNAYVRPHRHLGKVESMLVLAGSLQYITFTDDGDIEQCTKMGNYESGHTFYHSMREPKYHSMIIDSDWLIFLEITQGPFRKEDSEFASWSPEDTRLEEIAAFVNKIKRATA